MTTTGRRCGPRSGLGGEGRVQVARAEALQVERDVAVPGGLVVADTTDALKVCETSQLPAYYLPAADVRTDLLAGSAQRSLCEWKGMASYRTLLVPGSEPVVDAAWSYASPTPAFAPIRGHLAFYAARLDECWVGDDLVQPNPGSFYGGWWTPDVVGPFKGVPGSSGW